MANFPKFDKTRLRYGAHFAVMTSFGEKVGPLVENESMLTAAYNEFVAAKNNEDAAIKIARASEYSDQILKEDNKRDRLYTFIFPFVIHSSKNNPLEITLMAFIFCFFNAIMINRSVFCLIKDFEDNTFWHSYIFGLTTFSLGMYINIHS